MGKIFGIFGGVNLYAIQDKAPITDFVNTLPDQSCNIYYDRVSNSNKIDITLVGIDGNNKSNKEYYEECLQFLKDMQVETISAIRDRYKIMVDFIFTDQYGNVIDEGIRMYRLKSTDIGIINLLNENDELTYRRAKKFDMNMKFKFATPTPFGIKMENDSSVYYFKINEIRVMADVYKPNNLEDAYMMNLHAPLIDKTLSRNSLTIKSLSENMEEIYNSSCHSVKFNTIKMNKFPREVSIELKLLMNNFFEVNSDSEINDVITGNKNDDVPPVIPPVDPDEGTCPGDTTYYAKWKRYEPSDPMKYLVVPEDISDEELDETCMVKINDPKLIKDIPDIQVGEYVYYKEYINW